MLCYKDRTFCSAPCITPDCPDAITSDVIAAATTWSSGFGYDGALIAQQDMSPHCSDFTPAAGIKPPHWAVEFYDEEGVRRQ